VENKTPPPSLQDRTESRIDYRVLFGLWILSLALYAPLLGRWCISGDEFYTFEDSSFSISKMLSFNSRPLYFIVCHYLLKWNPGLPVELIIRLPAMFAASLVAPSLYFFLPRHRFAHAGILAGLIAIFNPLLFEMSQFGRYYAFVIFFATIATLAAIRWLEEPRKRWPILFFTSGLLAAVSHPPAVLLIPGGILAWLVAGFHENPEAVKRLLKKYGATMAVMALVAVAIGGYLLRDLFTEWFGAKIGDFGNSNAKDIVLALAILGGLSWWSLALVPMLRFPSAWSKQDVFLVTMLVGSTAPLLMLTPFGGGVAARYFLYCLPCMFLLAAHHWRQIDERLPSLGYRLALGCILFSFNVPYLLSIAVDGNHFDNRKVARAIEGMGIKNPMIFASSHRLVDYYLDDEFEIQPKNEDDLALFENGVPREFIEQAIAKASAENRPLLLVSRQDRTLMSDEDQQWLYARFAVVRTVETARYDHRRFRVIVYHYRPMKSVATENVGGHYTTTEDPQAVVEAIP